MSFFNLFYDQFPGIVFIYSKIPFMDPGAVGIFAIDENDVVLELEISNCFMKIEQMVSGSLEFSQFILRRFTFEYSKFKSF